MGPRAEAWAIGMFLIAGLACVVSLPAKLPARPAKSAAAGSAERRRVRGRLSRSPSAPTQDAHTWR